MKSLAGGLLEKQGGEVAGTYSSAPSGWSVKLRLTTTPYWPYCGLQVFCFGGVSVASIGFKQNICAIISDMVGVSAQSLAQMALFAHRE